MAGCLAGLLLIGSAAEAVGQTAPPAAPAQRGPSTDIVLDVPLRFGRQPLGDIAAVISRREELIAVDGAAFVRALADYVVADLLAGLKRRIVANGRLPVDTIRRTGLRVTYDTALIAIAVEAPMELQTIRALSLNRGYQADLKEVTGPARTSAYVNFLAGQDFTSDQGKQPLTLDLDGAANVLGNVVEGIGTYKSRGSVRWARDDVRFVRDDADSRIRYSAGDVSYNLDGFQSFQRTGGFAIARNFGLQPYVSSVPAGQSQLEIDRNSRVDVFINGQRVRTLDLQPGRYDVRDFPFSSGTNDVSLRITDEVGRVQVLRFPFIFDTTLLATGEQDFSYVAGVPSQTTSSGRSYDTGDWVFSAYHAYGLSDQLTLGANYQGSRDVQVAGAEGRFATILGTFRLDTTASLFRPADPANGGATNQTGYAVRLQHTYFQAPGADSANRNLSSNVTYRSPSFAALGQTTVSNPVSWDVSALYGQRLIGDLYGSIGGGRQFGRGGQPDVTTANVNFSMPLSETMNAYVLLSTRQPSQGRSDNELFFSISWFPGGSGHRLGASYDSSQRTSTLEWSYTPIDRVDVVNADLSLSRSAPSNSLLGDLGYTGYRFTSNVNRSQVWDRNGGSTSTQTTTLNLGTALAYADGHAAVTRPITDSFVLLPTHPSLGDQRIEINRSTTETPEARNDMVSPAVLPEIDSYYVNHVVIDAPDLPLGYELGQQIYDVRATYRSGILIPIGTGAVVLGDAILLSPAGEPLPLQQGTITSLDEPDRAPIEFFTSRAGRFRVEGLFPGRFKLTLANAPDGAVEFVVPPGSAGLVNLGRLTYKAEP
jgi:outer membrane usher protein